MWFISRDNFGCIVLVLLLCAKFKAGLKLTDVIVPRIALIGSVVTLRCDYDLEGEKLYAVKWFKDSAEFYRFGDEIPVRIFDHPGFVVQLSKNLSNEVSLRLITVEEAAGVYMCEVSTEAPFFHTELQKRRLDVIDPPYFQTKIAGHVKPRYEIGEVLDFTCSVKRSSIQTNLKMSVNDIPVSSDQIVYNVTKDLNLSSTNITVSRQHEGGLKLKCFSTIGDFELPEDEVTVRIETQSKTRQSSDSSAICHHDYYYLIICSTLMGLCYQGVNG